MSARQGRGLLQELHVAGAHLPRGPPQHPSRRRPDGRRGHGGRGHEQLRRRVRELERLREEVTKMKMAKVEGSRRAAQALTSSQSRVLHKALFALWTEDTQEAKRAKEWERLGRSAEVRELEARRRNGAMMANNFSTGLVRLGFTAWKDGTKEDRKGRELERLLVEVAKLKIA